MSFLTPFEREKMMATLRFCYRCEQNINDADWDDWCCGCLSHRDACPVAEVRSEEQHNCPENQAGEETENMIWSYMAANPLPGCDVSGKDMNQADFGTYFQLFLAATCPNLMGKGVFETNCDSALLECGKAKEAAENKLATVTEQINQLKLEYEQAKGPQKKQTETPSFGMYSRIRLFNECDNMHHTLKHLHKSTSDLLTGLDEYNGPLNLQTDVVLTRKLYDLSRRVVDKMCATAEECVEEMEEALAEIDDDILVSDAESELEN